MPACSRISYVVSRAARSTRSLAPENGCHKTLASCDDTRAHGRPRERCGEESIRRSHEAPYRNAAKKVVKKRLTLAPGRDYRNRMADLRELEAALGEALVSIATAREQLEAAPDDPNAQEAVRRAERRLEEAKAAVRRAFREK